MTSLSLLVLLALYGTGLFYLQPASPGTHVTLDAAVRFALDKNLKTVQFLDEDARITGTAVMQQGGSPQPFWTSYPRSDAATNDLLKTFFGGGAAVTVDPQAPKAIVKLVVQVLLPLMILANLFGILFFISRPASSGADEFLRFGRIGDKRQKATDGARTTFGDVAGMAEAVTELAEVRDYLANPSAYEAMGALPPKGVLLVGPPGCGKTLLARAVAGEADVPFYWISGSEFVESLVGIGAARVRDLFGQARADAPAILFIDELDAVGRQRGTGLGGGHDEREQTLNEMLVQLDGFAASEGVVVIGATNRVDILDPALIRPGRFDRHITVERPDVAGRVGILALHAAGKRLAAPLEDLPRIAMQSPGFTGADLANLLNEAALLAVRDHADAIELRHLEEGLERVVAGPRLRGQLLSEEEKRVSAFHEAGHAVVAAALGRAESIQKVSVIARGKGIGHLALLQEDRALLSRSDMSAQIAIAMGGVAAEEIVFGQPSTGSEQDLKRATNTARAMAGRYGMSANLGRMRLIRDEHEVFLGRDYLMPAEVSEPTLQRLDAEVHDILDREEEVARKLLVSNRDVLDGIAGALLMQETLQGPALQAELAGIRVRPRGDKKAAGAGRT